MRELIGQTYAKAEASCIQNGLKVVKIENNKDTKFNYDTELVTRVNIKDGVVYLTTSMFAFEIIN